MGRDQNITAIIITALLLGVGLAMDAFAVAVTNGMCSVRLKWYHAPGNGLIFGFFQALMPLIGLFFGLHFLHYIEAADHWVAFILLAGIGCNMIRSALRKEPTDDCSVPFTFRNLLLQGIATSIDALAVGVGFSATLSSMREACCTVAVIGVTTFLISTAGVYIGRLFGGLLKEKAEIFGGAVLIALGGKILLEHLFF